MTDTLSPQQAQAGLARLERLADLTDTRFRIPVLGIRFGIDALLGLIPVIGDGLGALISLYLLFEAVRLGLPWRLRVRMLINIGLDFVVGLIPLVGDIADVAWRANTRNTRLLRNWLEAQQTPVTVSARAVSGMRLTTVLSGILVALVCAAALYLLWCAEQPTF